MKKVGDIVANSKAVKIATSLTPHVMKLLAAAEEIRSEPDAAEAAFMKNAAARSMYFAAR